MRMSRGLQPIKVSPLGSKSVVVWTLRESSVRDIVAWDVRPLGYRSK